MPLNKQSAPTWSAILGLLLAILTVCSGGYVYAMAEHSSHAHADAVTRGEMRQIEKRIDGRWGTIATELRLIRDKLDQLIK